MGSGLKTWYSGPQTASGVRAAADCIAIILAIKIDEIMRLFPP
jgi:hypothetical protein